jgi:hypothetical protein
VSRAGAVILEFAIHRLAALRHVAHGGERMAEILGTSPSEMVGRPSFAYVFPEDVEAAHDHEQIDVDPTSTAYFVRSCSSSDFLPPELTARCLFA